MTVAVADGCLAMLALEAVAHWAGCGPTIPTPILALGARRTSLLIQTDAPGHAIGSGNVRGSTWATSVKTRVSSLREFRIGLRI